jgi:hypothetical protein
MIRVADSFLWLIRTASIAILALVAIWVLVTMRSFDVGLRCYQTADYYAGLLAVMAIVAGIGGILRKVKAPAAGLAAAVLAIHLASSFEEQAFRRAHRGEETGPMPRFVDSSWFSVDRAGNLAGGD